MKVMFRDMPFYKGPDPKDVEKEMSEPFPDTVEIPFQLTRWREWVPCKCGHCYGWAPKNYGTWKFKKVTDDKGKLEYICVGRGSQ